MAAKYSNPKVPEGISSGHEHPMVDVAKSSILVLALFAGLIILAYGAARVAAPLVPFSWEQKLLDRVPLLAGDIEVTDETTQDPLRALAARLAVVMDVPDNMVLTVHYVENDAVNGFATLGGHIIINNGLYSLLRSENAVAMLLGHEIAHIKNRDPISGASALLLMSLGAGLLLGDVGIIDDLLDVGSSLTDLHFSREQEDRADADATRAVVRLYGHLNGATDLFTVMERASEGKARRPAFLSTHPGLKDRIATIKRRARENGWPLDGEKTPMAWERNPF